MAYRVTAERPSRVIRVGDTVTLKDEPDCIVPPGKYRVSKVNPDGSFHCGGNTAVWPRRVSA